ncbi:MAG: hypothetical protein WAW63_02730 [Candidatus Saccharimonadales bacterium]
MAHRFEGGVIRLTPDLSEAAALTKGTDVIDFSEIGRDPHEVNAGAIDMILKGACDKSGRLDPNEYKVRLAGPNRVSVTPPLSDAARLALKGYFGADLINQHPTLEAVS